MVCMYLGWKVDFAPTQTLRPLDLTILVQIHATLCPTGLPLLSQDELSIDTWGTRDIARGGISMGFRAHDNMACW